MLQRERTKHYIQRVTLTTHHGCRCVGLFHRIIDDDVVDRRQRWRRNRLHRRIPSGSWTSPNSSPAHRRLRHGSATTAEDRLLRWIYQHPSVLMRTIEDDTVAAALAAPSVVERVVAVAVVEVILIRKRSSLQTHHSRRDYYSLKHPKRFQRVLLDSLLYRRLPDRHHLRPYTKMKFSSLSISDEHRRHHHPGIVGTPLFETRRTTTSMTMTAARRKLI